MLTEDLNRNLRKWQRLRVVKIVGWLSKVFCFSHPDPNLASKYRKLYITYFSLFWMWSAFINVHGLYEKCNIFYPMMPTSMAMLEAAFNAFVFISNFLASIDLVFLKSDKIARINTTLNRVEKLCHSYFKNAFKYDEREVVIVYVLITSLVFSSVSLTIIYFLYLIGIYVRSYIGMMFDITHISVLVLKVYLDLVAFRSLLKTLNKSMYECMYPKLSFWITSRPSQEHNRGKVLIKTYSELFDALKEMNAVYGFHFLTMILNVTVIVLHFCNYAMKLILNGTPNTFLTLLTTSSIIVAFTAFGILVTFTCDSVTQQVQETIDISYKILINTTECVGGKESRSAKESLTLFAEHVHSSRFHFSAAGQFPVDHTTLFMVFGSIAMYLLIIPLKS